MAAAAPSEFHMFGPLKDYLRGQRFKDDDAVKSAVKAWIRQCTPEYFAKGLTGKTEGRSVLCAMETILKNSNAMSIRFCKVICNMFCYVAVKFETFPIIGFKTLTNDQDFLSIPRM